jgi:hypothetical protein
MATLPIRTINGKEIEAVYATSSFSATSASYAQTASFVTASNVYGPFGSDSVISSSHALTASFVNPLRQTVLITGSLLVTGSSLFTGSIIHGVGISTGISSYAQGLNVTSSDDYAHAEGRDTRALFKYSHAEGFRTRASGSYTHAEGRDTNASGEYAHAEGIDTEAIGNGSHAEGGGTQAIGLNSHAEGNSTITISDYQHTQGQFNLPISGASAFIIGNGASTVSRSNLIFASGSLVQVTGSIDVTNGSIKSAYQSPYTSSAGNYTASIYDSTIEFTTGTGLALYPATGNIGRQLYIKNDGSSTVIVDASGSDTIDSQLTRPLGPKENLLIQSDGTSNWIILNKQPFTIQFAHEWTTGTAPADATTYFFGNFMTQDPSTVTSPSRQVAAVASGWVETVSLMVSVAGTLATSEDSTLVLRNVTTATSATVTSTLKHNSAAQLLNLNLSTPLQIRKGDVLEMRWTTPTWGTNPSAVRHIAQVFVN